MDEAIPGVLYTFSSPQPEKFIDLLEQGQTNAMKLFKEQDSLLSEEELKEVGFLAWRGEI